MSRSLEDVPPSRSGFRFGAGVFMPFSGRSAIVTPLPSA